MLDSEGMFLRLIVLGWIKFDPEIHMEKQWNLSWSNKHKPSDFNAGRSYQKMNHFPKTYSLGQKDKLCRLLRK